MNNTGGRPAYKMYKLLTDVLYCTAPYTEKVTQDIVIIDTHQWMQKHNINTYDVFKDICARLIHDGYLAKVSHRYSRTTVQVVRPPEEGAL